MQNKSRAFTLIELLVVVLIIGILAAVAVPQYTKAVEKARATEAMVMMRAIADANKRYYLANGSYATVVSDLDIEIPGEDSDYNQRKKTKHFKYGAKSYTEDDYIAVAQRLPTETNYVLLLDKVGGMWCKAYSTEGVKNCKTLGATDATKTGTLYEVKG